MKYFRQIDALRCFSVLIVIFHHLPVMRGGNLFSQFFHHFSGVDIFFVISGFLITRILIKSKQNSESNKSNLKTFYIRRFFRIFPIYYASILYLVLLNPGGYRDYFLNDLLYISNFKMGFDGTFASITPHFWSLSVEEQFYLFWPFLIFAVPFARNRLIKSIAIVFCVGVIGYYLFGCLDKVFLASRTITCLSYLAAGGVLGYLEMFQSQRFKNLSKAWPIVLAILIMRPILEFYGGLYIHSSLNFPLHIILSVLIVAKFVVGFKGVSSMFMEFKPVLFLGKISYGLYVYHFIAIHFITPINKFLGAGVPVEGYEGAMYKILFTIVIAICSWYLFENPINRLKNKFSYK